MILSQREIEEIAVAVVSDFQMFFFGAEADIPDRSPLPMPIDQFASQYLKMDVSFCKLSADGSVYGLTAYTDTEYLIETETGQCALNLKRNQIVMDEQFILPGNVRSLCGKRRFTLAHECAHQILFQLDADEQKFACHKKALAAAGARHLTTREDWNEWQANTLGAAILMPQTEVDRVMTILNNGKQLIQYGYNFRSRDSGVMEAFCSFFGVSKSAAAIRLQQLGYLVKKQNWKYTDPLDVWP